MTVARQPTLWPTGPDGCFVSSGPQPNCGGRPFSSRHACASTIDFLSESDQSRRYGDRERYCITQAARRLRQLGEATRCLLPDVSQCRRRSEAPAAAHDGYEQRFAGLLVIMESQHVAGHASAVFQSCARPACGRAMWPFRPIVSVALFRHTPEACRRDRAPACRRIWSGWCQRRSHLSGHSLPSFYDQIATVETDRSRGNPRLLQERAASLTTFRAVASVS